MDKKLAVLICLLAVVNACASRSIVVDPATGAPVYRVEPWKPHEYLLAPFALPVLLFGEW